MGRPSRPPPPLRVCPEGHEYEPPRSGCSTCPICSRIRQRAYERERYARRKRVHLQGPEAQALFKELTQQQDGCCAICGEKAQLGLDHNHTTGSIRGLLCGLCNLGIGYLKEDPQRLVQAIAYLEHWAQHPRPVFSGGWSAEKRKIVQEKVTAYQREGWTPERWAKYRAKGLLRGKYLLSGGMLLCSNCGGPFEGLKSTNVYVCATHRRRPSLCTNKISISMIHADNVVMSMLANQGINHDTTDLEKRLLIRQFIPPMRDSEMCIES